MKYSPRPYAPKTFSVEIKKSRRSPSSSDAPAKSARDPFLQNVPGSAGEDAFVAPAFLKAETRQARSDLQAHLEEAERLFSPKPAADMAQRMEPQAGPERAAPRILQSLVEAEAPQAAVDEPEPRRKAGRPKQDSAPRRLARRDAEAPAELAAAKAKAPAACAKRTVSAPVEPVAPHVENDAILLPVADKPARRRAMRRGLEDAAALPRGQHWKRRLHPRAWQR